MTDTPLGTVDNPYKVAPADWDIDGLPYGVFCECDRCGQISRSTVMFDYYADAKGKPLVCESCTVY